MSGMRQKIQYSLALEPAHQGETPVGGCQGTEPVVVKPAPQSPALAPTPCRCPSLTPSNRRVRDPYARWCGRGGTARCPPIPIIGASRPLPRVPGVPLLKRQRAFSLGRRNAFSCSISDLRFNRSEPADWWETAYTSRLQTRPTSDVAISRPRLERFACSFHRRSFPPPQA